jgi:hypothetical protein
MTKVSEEQPRDTFSLFLRLMSIGDYPDVDTLPACPYFRRDVTGRPLI